MTPPPTTPPTTLDDLQALLSRKDPAAIAEAFEGMDEAERRRFSKPVGEALAGVRKYQRTGKWPKAEDGGLTIHVGKRTAV